MKTEDIVFDLCVLGVSLLLLIGGAIQIAECQAFDWIVLYHIAALALGGSLSWAVVRDLKRNWDK